MPLDIFKGVSKAMAPLVARKIGKEEFLDQLREAWTPVVKVNTDIEYEVAQAMDRIKKSGFERAFKAVDITEKDLTELLSDIRRNKGEPITNPNRNVGRNDPCPCGSGKKYKRCCGR